MYLGGVDANEDGCAVGLLPLDALDVHAELLPVVLHDLADVVDDDGGLDAHEVAGQDGPPQQREVPRSDEGDLVERDVLMIYRRVQIEDRNTALIIEQIRIRGHREFTILLYTMAES